jgi:hypothetical protein
VPKAQRKNPQNGVGSGMSRRHFLREEISVSKVEGKEEKLLEHLWHMPISFSFFFRDVFSMEIGQLRSYANAVEQIFVEQMHKINDEFQEHTAGKSEAEREALLDWYGGEVASLTCEYPKILRYSLFVHSYRLLERVLVEIASHYRQMRHLELSPSELRDKGIEQARDLSEESRLSAVSRHRIMARYYYSAAHSQSYCT